MPRRSASAALALAPALLLVSGCGLLLPRPDTAKRARPDVLAAARPAAGDSAACALPRSTPEAAGIAGPAFDSLVAGVQASGSDALVVLRDGRVAYEWYRDRDGAAKRRYIQSISKPVSALAIGTLLDDGTLRSLDQPLGDFFPTWREGARGQVTLRMLLEHTSGVAAGSGSLQLYRRRDALAWALRQPLAEPPGTTWRYNNVGIFLAASAAAQAAGRPLAAVANERLFAPLCITDVKWAGDRAGHTFAAGDLELRATDLAKVGQLVLDRGAWRGRQLVSAAYVDAITRREGGTLPAFVNPRGATSWFVRPVWDSTRVDDATVAAWRDAARSAGDSVMADTLAAYAGRSVETWSVWRALWRATGTRSFDALAARLVDRPAPVRTVGRAAMIEHSGDRGQYLVIFPGSRIVVVRQRRLTLREDPWPAPERFYELTTMLNNAVLAAQRAAAR